GCNRIFSGSLPFSPTHYGDSRPKPGAFPEGHNPRFGFRWRFRGRGDVLWFGRRFELSDLLRCIKKGRAPSVLREVSLRFQWWLKIAAGVAFWALNVEMACGL